MVRKTCSLLRKKCKLGICGQKMPKNANIICESSLRNHTFQVFNLIVKVCEKGRKITDNNGIPRDLHRLGLRKIFLISTNDGNHLGLPIN